MAPSRNRTLRTQEEQDAAARALWDQLFVEEDKRQRSLARIPVPSDSHDDDSDEDLITPSPIYDKALNVQGPDRVLRMCNFAPIEFERLWECVEDHVLAHWNAPPLTLTEREENDRISHDRVIVENVFGRLKTLWGVCSHKWKWDRDNYNLFFRVCMALTNYSVRCCPLRRDDGDAFQRYDTRLRQIGDDHKAHEKRKRESHRDNRRSRLELSSRGAIRTRTSPLQQTPARRRRTLDSRHEASPCSTEWGTP
ncbi:hypothetical protein DVH05_002791 [Phytophthora capsici]|nr:hypothetical protein DVH05_002791 [Phytophthora capsici]